MATQGPNDPGTIVSDPTVGISEWANPGNASADDGANASASLGAGAQTEYLLATNFGFSIPSGATIDGITVTWQKGVSAGEAVNDFRVRIVKGGTVGSEDKSNGSWESGSVRDDSYRGDRRSVGGDVDAGGRQRERLRCGTVGRRGEHHAHGVSRRRDDHGALHLQRRAVVCVVSASAGTYRRSRNRGGVLMPQMPSSEPTPDEIRERCEVIQSEWCEQERRRRIADDAHRRQSAGWRAPQVRAAGPIPVETTH